MRNDMSRIENYQFSMQSNELSINGNRTRMAKYRGMIMESLSATKVILSQKCVTIFQVLISQDADEMNARTFKRKNKFFHFNFFPSLERCLSKFVTLPTIITIPDKFNPDDNTYAVFHLEIIKFFFSIFLRKVWSIERQIERNSRRSSSRRRREK